MGVFFHVTLTRKVASILRHGLLTRYATGRRKAVWVVPRRLVPWAILHVVNRHKTTLESVVVAQLNVPGSWLKRHAGGTLYTRRDVPVAQIVSFSGVTQWTTARLVMTAAFTLLSALACCTA